MSDKRTCIGEEKERHVYQNEGEIIRLATWVYTYWDGEVYTVESVTTRVPVGLH